MTLDVPLLWSCVVLLALTMYVLLDGFDLGVGMLLLSSRSEADRELMIRSIAPVWDGNETWLVLVGAGLLGGFPAAYGIALPAFYLPLILMLLCLAFRGTAFEFRFQSGRPWLWDVAFSIGSWGAALCQGVIIGALLKGVRVRGMTFAGTTLDCLRPFGILTGIAVALAYSTLGSTWLIWRTSGSLNSLSRRRARIAAISFVSAVLLVVLSARWLAPELIAHASRWSAFRVAVFIALLVAITAVLYRSLSQRSEWAPFACAVTAVMIVTLAFVYTVWPYLIPYQVDFRDAASAERSQIVLLCGALFILPFVLAYSAYSYFLFRGKVTPEAHEWET